MSLIAVTVRPRALLRLLREAIDEESVRTWTFDKDGDFTHRSAQWGRAAWFRPVIADGKIIFNILKPMNTSLSTTVYAVYHSELTQVLLAHFDKHCERVSCSAMPTAGDRV